MIVSDVPARLTPLVSVVIPTFRRPVLMRRAVDSVLAQTVRDIEVLLIVEHDDVASIEAVRAIDDPRVRSIVLAKNCRPGEARDAGALASLAPWVAFLDDDDEWLPAKLECQIARAAVGARVIVTTLYRVVGPFGMRVIPSVPYDGKQDLDEWLFDRRSWLKGGQRMLQTSSLLVPRALFEKLHFGKSRHEEWEFVLRAVKQHGYHLLTAPEPLVIYYTGNAYAWEPSVLWVRSVCDLLTQRAVSGFCLTVAPHGIRGGSDRNRAFRTLLTTAFRIGRPTVRQLFAFCLMWLLPDRLRQRIRIWQSSGGVIDSIRRKLSP